MNTFQIQCFLEAAQEQNFSRAAQKLFITQPGMSRYISTLENELHLRLFQRTANKRIQLTAAGHAYYDLFRRTAQELSDLSDRYRPLESDPFGQFRLGYLGGWDISTFLPQMMEQFQKSRPGVVVQLLCMNYLDLYSSLVNGELEVVLLPDDYLVGASGIEWQEVTQLNQQLLYSDKMLEKVPNPDSPAAFRDQIFYVPDDSLIRRRSDRVEAFCREYGFVPKLRSANSIETVLTYVKSGIGVTLCDNWNRCIHTPGFHNLTLNKQRGVVLAWPAGVTHGLPQRIVLELQDILRQLPRDLGGSLPAQNKEVQP